MKRQQHRKNYPSGIRSAGGQTTLQSFLVKPRVVDAEVKPSPPPPPPEVGEEEPPKREIVRVIRKTIKEKASAFSSVGSASAGKDGGGEAGGALSAAVFKRFHSSAPVARAEGDRAEAGEDGDLEFGGGGEVRLDVEEIGAASRPEPRNKRKSALGGDEHGGDAKARRVVVLGDDPRPRPAWRPGRASPPAAAARARAAAPCTTTTRAGAVGGTATWKAWTARRSAGPTCGREWAPSRSAAWSGTSRRRRRPEQQQNRGSRQMSRDQNVSPCLKLGTSRKTV